MSPLGLRTLQERKNTTSCTNECRAAKRINNWTSARGHTASRKTKMQWNKDHRSNNSQMRSIQKEHEEIMPYVSGDLPFMHALPCIHEEQASVDYRDTIIDHLKNEGHETSGLKTIGRRCQGSVGRQAEGEQVVGITSFSGSQEAKRQASILEKSKQTLKQMRRAAHLGSQVLENCSKIDRCTSSHSLRILPGLEKASNPSHRELQTRLLRTGYRLGSFSLPPPSSTCSRSCRRTHSSASLSPSLRTRSR